MKIIVALVVFGLICSWALADNALYIDRDGDGYGVASPLGPDADDTDPTVNTWGSVQAAYGSLEAFLAAKGHSPNRIINVIPGASYGSLHPGDYVVYSAGTYQDKYPWGVDNLHGTSADPIVFMARPGERVVFDGEGGMGISNSSYLVIDGFVTDHTTGWYGQGVNIHFSSNITIRNLEATGHERGIYGAQDLHDILVENSVMHDNPVSHGIYWGAREYPNSNLVVRDSLIYRNGRHGFQHNGRVTGLVLEGNQIHTNNLGGVSFINGVSQSIVRDNLIFNNNKQGIVSYTYDESNVNIYPYPIEDNLFEGNIIWVGTTSWNGNYNPPDYPAIQFNDTQGVGMDRNSIVNNIIVTYGGELLKFNQADYADTAVIEDNQFFRYWGEDGVYNYGGQAYSWEEFLAMFPGNLYGELMFIDVDPSYFDNLNRFDFGLVPEPGSIFLYLWPLVFVVGIRIKDHGFS